MLWGYMYETTLLQTQAKLAPRILLMGKGIPFKEPNRFSICIVHEPGDEKTAAAFKESLLANYPSGWRFHSMEVADSIYASMEQKCADSEMLYLLNTSEPNINKAVEMARRERKLTMAYEHHYLSYGVMLSLYVGRDIRPYLNLDATSDAGIAFENDLVEMSRVFDAADDSL